MKESTAADLLSRGIDQLIATRREAGACLTIFTGYQKPVESLLLLAKKLAALLVPVEPLPSFREGLGQELLAVAQEKMASPRLTAQAHGRRWEILVGAAVGSLVSVAAVVALVARARGWNPRHIRAA